MKPAVENIQYGSNDDDYRKNYEKLLPDSHRFHRRKPMKLHLVLSAHILLRAFSSRAWEIVSGFVLFRLGASRLLSRNSRADKCLLRFEHLLLLSRRVTLLHILNMA